MKLLPFLPFLGTVLGNESDKQANTEPNSPDKEKMAEKLADKMEQIPEEKPKAQDPSEIHRKLGTIHWENVYFEDTLDILGSKKAVFPTRKEKFHAKFPSFFETPKSQ